MFGIPSRILNLHSCEMDAFAGSDTFGPFERDLKNCDKSNNIFEIGSNVGVVRGVGISRLSNKYKIGVSHFTLPCLQQTATVTNELWTSPGGLTPH
jgi:hypothetical protein